MFKKSALILSGLFLLELAIFGILRSSLAPLLATEMAAREQFSQNQLFAPEGFAVYAAEKKYPWINNGLVSEAILGEFLMEIRAEINRPYQNAVLVIENNRAIDFRPHADGLVADLFLARKNILAALASKTDSAETPVMKDAPETRLSDLNDLGIKDLLVSGQTDFTGSTAARITNIRVGSSQYNGIIIKPGEEFSFTDNLGPVDAEHGFKPELVIKPEGATPEFGGGLCQVSTTAFRAAFFAGLPITERRNHSYAVHYYDWIGEGKPRVHGLDATIYSGSQDMKFMNDTPGAILIWTRMEGKRLYFDFYGTADDRQITVDGPYEYDRLATGALKARVTRTVTKEGKDPEVVTFRSSYVPPKTLPQVTEYPKPPPPTEPAPAPLTN